MVMPNSLRLPKCFFQSSAVNCLYLRWLLFSQMEIGLLDKEEEGEGSVWRMLVRGIPDNNMALDRRVEKFLLSIKR